MYQYSLKYFKQVKKLLQFRTKISITLIYNLQIFNMVIDTSEKNPDLVLRLNILYDEITLAVYVNVSRGLFERHKLIFSFMLCIDIMKQAGEIMDSQWNFLLRGPIGSKGDYPKKPDISTLSENMWTSANYVANTFECFSHLIKNILTVISITMGHFTQVNTYFFYYQLRKFILLTW